MWRIALGRSTGGFIKVNLLHAIYNDLVILGVLKITKKTEKSYTSQAECKKRKYPKSHFAKHRSNSMRFARNFCNLCFDIFEKNDVFSKRSKKDIFSQKPCVLQV